MKIIVAPDSFKGSRSSIEVADLIEKGIRNVYPDAEIVKIPIADGGEGTVDAAVSGADGEYREMKVRGPLGDPVKAKYGILKGGRAVIEMAAASGLPLVPENKRNPLFTTTYGTGELIESALEEGCREFLLGIGGSATTDAGMGMAQALGYSFKDKDGNELGDGGGELAKLVEIDSSGADPRVAESRFTVASDVNNPLYGKEGAAYIYGPQKGATPEMVKELDANLRLFAKVVEKTLGRDISQIPGAGAAGGLGAGLIVFCGAELKSGIQAVLDIVGFDNHIESTDLVITGEGAIDGQSTYGKVPVGIAQRVQKHDIPVLAIVGNIGPGAENVYNFGIHGIMSTVNKAMPLSEAMANSAALLEEAAERVMRIIGIGRKLR
jgi:glycerate kinase